MPDVQDVLNKLGDFGGGTVSDAVGGISSWLKGGGAGASLLEAVKKGVEEAIKAILGNKTLLKELAKLLAEAAAEITNGLADGIGGSTKALVTAISRLIDAVLEKLLDALGDVLGAFPAVLRQGPLNSLKAGKELGDLLATLGVLQGVKDRAEVVANSVAKLITSAGGPGGAAILADGVAKVAELFKSLLGTATPEQKLIEFLKDLVFPRKLFTDLLTQAAQGKLWAWVSLPSGLMPGSLNAWLNHKSTYVLDASGEPKFLALEREFRTRLIAVADAYLRGTVGDTRGVPPPMMRSDERLSAGGVSDAVLLFVDTVVQFIFEPDCMPKFDFELDGFEDLGVQFASLYARQLRLVIRAAIGLLLRGIWGFSLMNEVLIELIAVTISVVFSAALDGIIRHLTWSLQITSRYKALTNDGGNGIHTWGSLERAEWEEVVSGMPVKRFRPLEYVVFVRTAGLDSPSVPLGGTVKGLVEDFGAYLDVCYLQFRIGSRFPAIATDEKVAVTRADLMQLDAKTDLLTVWATTTAKFEKPRPVLRVYVCCHVFVMRPADDPADSYTLEVKLPRLRQRCVAVTALSNRGGRSDPFPITRI